MTDISTAIQRKKQITSSRINLMQFATEAMYTLDSTYATHPRKHEKIDEFFHIQLSEQERRDDFFQKELLEATIHELEDYINMLKEGIRLNDDFRKQLIFKKEGIPSLQQMATDVVQQEELVPTTEEQAFALSENRWKKFKTLVSMSRKY